MKIYRVIEPEVVRYEIIASHKWCLPGVICPKCGTWSNTGIEYPNVDLSGFKEEKSFRKARAVDLKEFNLMRKSLETYLKDKLLLTGTDFGPLVGTVTGKLSDIVFSVPWTLLVNKNVFEILRNEGLRSLKGVSAILKSKSKKKTIDKYIEIEIEPYTYLVDRCFPNGKRPMECELCGRRGITVPENIILDKKTIPEDVDIFRGKDLTTYIFVTERFKEVVEKHQLTGAEFKPIEVE